MRVPILLFLLFEQFKKIMHGSPPKMIITDQDPAMTKAISHSFPETFHRYCSWHILNKFSDHIDINEKPVLKLPFEMEKQMAQIYTRNIFFTNVKMSCGVTSRIKLKSQEMLLNNVCLKLK
ncbi:hypothetical protein Dsin_013226 [Dipteronia sinensis]|uniref:Protein FAR1-RELATED SEQUENCE n=1 Tax=Dipteronia sinensis TaxID=43782 RepID=A0AAE0AJR2_9ROSI|nr:hypothetical protein Dsin_013226 [Dipteronia sinensis]